MSIHNAEPVELNQLGSVTINPPTRSKGVQIVVQGFDARGGTCRDVVVLACLWAIGELQREVMRHVERPGGGSIGIG